MNLWHDDIRPPVPGYTTWVRTNDDAKAILSACVVEAVSLDHDLGLHQANPVSPGSEALMGSGDETGYDLLKWMVSADCVPDNVRIHSWNRPGAENMRAYLSNAVQHRAISNHPTIVVLEFQVAEYESNAAIWRNSVTDEVL